MSAAYGGAKDALKSGNMAAILECDEQNGALEHVQRLLSRKAPVIRLVLSLR